jgi:hypothetical protein
VQEFLACCSVSVSELKRARSGKKGLLTSQGKEFVQEVPLIFEAPSPTTEETQRRIDESLEKAGDSSAASEKGAMDYVGKRPAGNIHFNRHV